MWRSSMPCSSMILESRARASLLSSSRRNSRTFSVVMSPWKSKYRFSKRYRASSFTEGLLRRRPRPARRHAAIPTRGRVTQGDCDDPARGRRGETALTGLEDGFSRRISARAARSGNALPLTPATRLGPRERARAWSADGSVERTQGRRNDASVKVGTRSVVRSIMSRIALERTIAVVALLAASAPLAACGSEDEGPRGPQGPHDSSGGTEPIQVYVAALDAAVPTGESLLSGIGAAAPSRLLQLGGEDATSVSDCETLKTQGTGEGPSRGVCITPVNIRGWAESIELSGTVDDQQVAPDGTPVPGACGPGRLLAVNSFVDSGN